MMKAYFKLTVPKDANATLTCVMTIHDWQLLYDQLSKSDASFWHPTQNLKNAIRDVIEKANTAFESEDAVVS